MKSYHKRVFFILNDSSNILVNKISRLIRGDHHFYVLTWSDIQELLGDHNGEGVIVFNYPLRTVVDYFLLFGNNINLQHARRFTI